jgi:hypothetical protein
MMGSSKQVNVMETAYKRLAMDLITMAIGLKEKNTDLGWRRLALVIRIKVIFGKIYVMGKDSAIDQMGLFTMFNTSTEK